MISVTSLVFVCWTVALVSSQDGVDMNEIEEIVEQKAYEGMAIWMRVLLQYYEDLHLRDVENGNENRSM